MGSLVYNFLQYNSQMSHDFRVMTHLTQRRHLLSCDAAMWQTVALLWWTEYVMIPFLNDIQQRLLCNGAIKKNPIDKNMLHLQCICQYYWTLLKNAVKTTKFSRFTFFKTKGCASNTYLINIQNNFLSPWRHTVPSVSQLDKWVRHSAISQLYSEFLHRFTFTSEIFTPSSHFLIRRASLLQRPCCLHTVMQ